MKNSESIEVSKKIDAFIRGNLTQSEIDELWLIFMKNPEYYELFETELHLRNLIQNERHAGGLNTEKDRFSGNYIKNVKFWIFTAAAVVLIAITVGIFLAGDSNDLSPELLAISSIDYSEMAGGDIERSDDQQITANEVALNQAVAAAYILNEEESIEKFKELQGLQLTDSQKRRVDLNLAILYYNMSDYESARTLLIAITEAVEMDELYRERAWWYLANTHLKLNDPVKAKEAIIHGKLLEGRNSGRAIELYYTLEQRKQ